MDKKIILNRKDRDILYFLFKSKISTSMMINQVLFPESKIRGINQRLRNLAKFGYIERKYVNFHSLRPICINYLTNRGFQVFNENYNDSSGIKLKSDKIFHDYQLSILRQHFTQVQNVNKVWSENEIILQTDFNKVGFFKDLKSMRSDAAIEVNWRNESIKIAIEYEASLKKANRYMDKFISYYEKSSIHGVLYVCEFRDICQKLIALENTYNDSGSSKVFYIHIDDFLKSKAEIPFINRMGKKIKIFS